MCVEEFKNSHHKLKKVSFLSMYASRLYLPTCVVVEYLIMRDIWKLSNIKNDHEKVYRSRDNEMDISDLLNKNILILMKVNTINGNSNGNLKWKTFIEF